MWHKHKAFWLQKNFLVGALAGAAFLGVSLLVTYYANLYTIAHVSKTVTDLLLDHLPVVDVHLIFSEGAVLFVLLLAALLLYEPKYIPFTLKALAVFYLIRSCFMVLTHIGPPQNEIFINPSDFIASVSSGNDLFFSAHTGLPFLMALIFWRQKFFRYLFFICSFVGGAAVLLGHLHYSIDVFSALFIAYGIFHLCKKFFRADYRFISSAA